MGLFKIFLVACCAMYLRLYNLYLWTSAVLSAATLTTTSTSGEKDTVVRVPLTKYLNNRAFGAFPGDANFNGAFESYNVADLAGYTGTFSSPQTGTDYNFPASNLTIYDNIVCEGQLIPIPPDQYFSVQFLVASDSRETILANNVTFRFADNTTVETEIRAEPWWAFLTMYKGDLIFPTRFMQNKSDYNTTHIFEVTKAVNPAKTLTAVELPSTTNTTDGRIHVFAMSLNIVSGLVVQNIRPTQKRMDGDTSVQIVEITIGNAGPAWVLGAGVSISLEAPGVKTVKEAKVKRLAPGDQRRVDVAVVADSVSNETATVKVTSASETSSFTFPEYEFGLKNYTEDLSSLTLHESPDWFNKAKYGIFIHWGPYAVPGWGNSTPNEIYAEWYWFYTHHPAADKSGALEYGLRTFGPDVVYDDFFQNFTASKFDPKEWVDLFDAAGAQYFVLTSKHHDGFAIFDTEKTTNRNSLKYGPKRDVLKEVFDAAKKYQPHLHRGTYFSLPEWYNPDFGKYGFASHEGADSLGWPGIIARNPYTGKEEPYTGRLPIDDFVEDLLVPQQEILAYKYETEIMWCDCGAANGSAGFMSKWFNEANALGRQITINSRCGIAEGSDFSTPEYLTFSSVSTRKWESSQGMDPYSYGYNRATPDSDYMNASTVVTKLVDMTSKNGNFLLDIGPKADGTIVDVEAQALRAAGVWIKKHAEAIFNSTYWFIEAEEGEHIRFTQTNDAFYILFLEEPVAGQDVVIHAPLPIYDGDIVTVLTEDIEVKWSRGDDGISFSWPKEMAGKGEYCWVLKIEYAA
ncbi:putative alpha-L-fucosidase [Phyllosticta citrichinensis]